MCGAVRFEVEGDIVGDDLCHCSICRKYAAVGYAGAQIKRTQATVHGMDRVTWYATSEKAKRGFCSTCGAHLFWEPGPHRDWLGVYLGAFDEPTGAKIKLHIFVDNKGDYYDIADGLPAFGTIPPKGWHPPE